MSRHKSYSLVFRARAVRLVLEQQDEYDAQLTAIKSVAGEVGCSVQALRQWVRLAKLDQGKRAGLTRSECERLRQLERENHELRRDNEILRKASAIFAQAELNR